ncbi:uncharacterized protein [Coffea arabica]|uniref:Ubiquitin fusion degradation protein 1 homolog n=1 Tax=Coffea arabica TaxID=13443 RepID=A0ABM4VFF0_COFAR
MFMISCVYAVLCLTMDSLTTRLKNLGEYNQFVQHYFCHSFATIQKHELDKGNKILMPASALDCLSALRIHYPMMFSIQNIYDDSGGRTSHCGVLEFTAEGGSIFAPQWMMDSLKILEGDLVLLKSVYLPKGTFVKLQPHTTDFINLSNPKAVLEKTLQRYACLTTGDTITISHDKKKFQIDVLEAEPSPAISIIDTDCEVDFAAPLDYKEPEKKASQKVEEEKPKFVAFSGLARRIDGAPLAHLSDIVAEKLEKNVISKKNSTKTCDCEGPGKKMVFDSNTINKEPPNKYDVKKEEVNKFEPFTGRKNVTGS